MYTYIYIYREREGGGDFYKNTSVRGSSLSVFVLLSDLALAAWLCFTSSSAAAAATAAATFLS